MLELLTHYPVIPAVMVALALAESIWALFIARCGYNALSCLASIGVAAGELLFKPLSAILIGGIYFALYAMTPLRVPIEDWRSWVVGFFAVEFAYYWFHRFSHRINWLWATHAVHHSANELTLPAAVRLGWTGVLSGGWLIFAPLILMGFAPSMVGMLLGLNLLYQFGLHTEAVRKLGPLEWVFNTPSHHRAHHASDEPWLDCNFGGVLIIFDRMFGTFVPEPAAGGLRYGLTDPIVSNNPFTIALRQWVIMAQLFHATASNRDRWRIVVGRPTELAAIRQRQTADCCKPPMTELDFAAASE